MTPLKYIIFLIGLLSPTTWITAQHNQQKCGFDDLHAAYLKSNPQHVVDYLEIESQILDYQLNQSNTFSGTSAPFVIPVVLHVISPPGTPVGSGNNITVTEAERGLAYLNDIFANRGNFNAPNGIDTEISFCLARRDPQNMPTDGITRTNSPLVNENQCNPGTDQASDAQIKQLVSWDCTQYLNIWLVTDLFSGNNGCGLAGYAYFPGANCRVDGIVVESRYWHTQRGSFIVAHEVGHYLGLYHTFQGGCLNDDCLRDGDRVCDTPPDDSPSFAPCGTNSCATDNPDLVDDTENIMDYTNCQPMHFTQGQTTRMHASLMGPRMSLLNSNSCLPVVDRDLGLNLAYNLSGVCTDTICPVVVFQNLGLETITEATIRYQVDGGAWQVFNWQGSIQLNETRQVELPCIQSSAGPHLVTIEIINPNQLPDQANQNNVISYNLELFEKLIVSTLQIKAARCQSNGVAEFTATGGTPPYRYSFETGQPLQTSGYFNLLTRGTYQITVTDQNGCVDSLQFTIPDSCAQDTVRRFVLNGDATHDGASCYTLTRDRRSRVGSIWYEDFVSLENDFIVKFDMNLGCRDQSGADGIAFVLQPISTTIGILGGGIGYQGISPSIAAEFDTWQNNNFNDPAYDHLAIIQDGEINHASVFNLAGPVGIIPSAGNVEDCNWRSCIIKWLTNEHRLEVYVDCELRLTYEGDIIRNIFSGDPLVYFGFTAATGGSTNVHQVCVDFVNATDKLTSDTICLGDVIAKSAPSNFTSYNWTPTIGVSDPSSNSPLFSPDQTTTYIVEMTEDCLVARDSFTIHVIEVEIDTVLLSPDSCGLLNKQAEIIINPPNAQAAYSLDGISFKSDNILLANQGINTAYVKIGRCISKYPFEVTMPPALEDSLIVQLPESCREKGLFHISGQGGTPPYLYRIDNGNFTNSGFFDELDSGMYMYTVRDALGCEISGKVAIGNVTGTLYINIDSSDLRVDCCHPGTFIQVSSGTNPQLRFVMDDLSESVDGLFTGIAPGSHYIYARDESECPSDTIWFEVKEYVSNNDTLMINLCQGGDTLINGKSYETSGVFIDTVSSIFCCDSTLTIFIDVTPLPIVNHEYRICEGDSISVNGKYYHQEGQYLDTISRLDQCDSLIRSTLRFNEVSKKSLSFELCRGESLDIGHRIIDTQGTFHDTLTNRYGCDSVVTSQVNVFPVDTQKMRVEGCSGTQVEINDSIFEFNGQYQIALQNRFGCDSIILLNLIVHEDFLSQDTIEICPSETIKVHGTDISNVGNYTFEFQSQYGCDSLYHIEVIHHPTQYCDDLVQVYIPNVFSPNGDGLNDRFTVFGNDQLAEVIEMRIYDRWGEQIFIQESFPPNNTDFGWDGLFKNEPMLPGLYVYWVKVKLLTGTELFFSGDVTLLK